MIYITNVTLFSPERRFENGMLKIEGDKIVYVGRTENNKINTSESRVIDGEGCYLVPGYIDLQINGAFGRDFTREPEAIWEIAKLLPRFGVTSFLPTIVTSPYETYSRAQEVLLNQMPEGFIGAKPLGLHFEGPFINIYKKGAHNPNFINQPSLEAIRGWEKDKGVLLVTLAPELPGSIELISQLNQSGVVVSAGHSMASYKEAQKGIGAGLSYGTHLFNAMPPLHHRDPGLIGALLQDDRITVGMIVDGVHVDPVVVKIIWNCLGSGRLNLVSDAIEALGKQPGRYHVHDYKIIVDEKCARLADGTLAGNISSLDSALRNLINFTGCNISEALKSITSTPADLLSIGEIKGRLQDGAIADVVLLSSNLEVILTLASGKVVYKNPKYPNFTESDLLE